MDSSLENNPRNVAITEAIKLYNNLKENCVLLRAQKKFEMIFRLVNEGHFSDDVADILKDVYSNSNGIYISVLTMEMKKKIIRRRAAFALMKSFRELENLFEGYMDYLKEFSKKFFDELHCVNTELKKSIILCTYENAEREYRERFGASTECLEDVQEYTQEIISEINVKWLQSMDEHLSVNLGCIENFEKYIQEMEQKNTINTIAQGSCSIRR